MGKKRNDPARSEEQAMDPVRGEAYVDEAEALAARLPRDRKARREALQLIADALIDRALEGSASHVKSLIELGVYEPGALRPKRRTRKGTAELLLERWEQQRDGR